MWARSVFSLACASITALGIALAPAAALAEQAVDEGVVWRPEWARFGAVDWATSGVLAGVLLTTTLAFNNPSTRFRGGILFDEPVRDALRIHTETGRVSAGNVSDVLQVALIAYPLVIDSLLLTWIARDSSDAALEMLLMNGEAFLISATLVTVTKDISGRARPYTESCGNDTCGSTGRNKSFFSGHSTAAFTGAGLICANHGALALYESEGSDTAVCVAALLLASATGVLRIASDDHYASDVIVGALVGIAAGYLFPRLAFYRPEGTRFMFSADPGIGGARLSISGSL